MKLIPLLATLLFSVTSLYAQRFYPSGLQSREKISIGIGSSTYQGDLQEGRSLASTPDIMLSYEYQLNPRFTLRGDGVLYRLKGSDVKAVSTGKRERNLSFHSTNYELSSSVMVHLFRQLPANYANRRVVNIYGLLGFGLTYYNPKTTYKGQVYQLRDFSTEGISYGKFTPVIPSGMGLEFKAGRKFNVALEATYRITFTDYLDDVSTTYPDQSLLASELAMGLSDRRRELGLEPMAAGSQRGNPAFNDGYAFLNIRLIYFIDKVYYQAKDKKKRLKR